VILTLVLLRLLVEISFTSANSETGVFDTTSEVEVLTIILNLYCSSLFLI